MYFEDGVLTRAVWRRAACWGWEAGQRSSPKNPRSPSGLSHTQRCSRLTHKSSSRPQGPGGSVQPGAWGTPRAGWEQPQQHPEGDPSQPTPHPIPPHLPHCDSSGVANRGEHEHTSSICAAVQQPLSQYAPRGIGAVY